MNVARIPEDAAGPGAPLPGEGRRGGLVLSGGSIGLLLAGAACLAWGAWSALSTRRFVARAMRAEGVVFHAECDESNYMLVEVRDAAGRVERTVSVSIAWWTPPTVCLRGRPVRILYDPTADPAPLFLGSAGRIDSWGQLWSGSVMWCAVGLLLVGGWLAARLTGGRSGVTLRFERLR